MPLLTGEKIDLLPVFAPDPGAILFDDVDMVMPYSRHIRLQFAAEKSRTFIRQTRVVAIRATSLKEVVETADEIFLKTASFVGAQVVPHTWGLYPLTKPISAYFADTKHLHDPNLIPYGYVLAAEVTSIKEAQPMVHEPIINSITVNGYQWTDSNSTQFVYGTEPEQRVRGLWLTDIEPKLGLVI